MGRGKTLNRETAERRFKFGGNHVKTLIFDTIPPEKKKAAKTTMGTGGDFVKHTIVTERVSRGGAGRAIKKRGKNHPEKGSCWLNRRTGKKET